MYDSDGDAVLDATAFTVTLSGTTVTLTSLVALEHSNAPQGVGEDNTLDLDSLINVVATVTVTDGDEDVVSEDSTSTGLSLTFDDTDPTLEIHGGGDGRRCRGGRGERSRRAKPGDDHAAGLHGECGRRLHIGCELRSRPGGRGGNRAADDGRQPCDHAGGRTRRPRSRAMYDSDGDATLDATAFTVTLSGTTVTLTSLVALEHSNAPQGVGEDNTLDLDSLINVVATVTVTDGDEDVVSEDSTTSTGLSLTFNDTDPTITAAFDADGSTPGIQTPEELDNSAGATASGVFGYDMADKHTAAEHIAGVGDFVDTNGALAGVQISLTGTVDNAQNPDITQAVATLASEDDLSALFDFSFHYDKDPITAGVQDATAGGTLAFDKVADTYTITLDDPIDGFSFDVLHTNELLAKAPYRQHWSPVDRCGAAHAERRSGSVLRTVHRKLENQLHRVRLQHDRRRSGRRWGHCVHAGGPRNDHQPPRRLGFRHAVYQRRRG